MWYADFMRVKADLNKIKPPYTYLRFELSIDMNWMDVYLFLGMPSKDQNKPLWSKLAYDKKHYWP